MSWIRRETEKGAVQYICPHCHDYHEFREDFGGRTFSENYIFCRRCGARNGTGNAPTLTQPNEWVSVEDRLPEPTYCVLVYTTDYSIEVDALDSDGEWMSFEVTHWMLLPAPPDRRPPEGEEVTQ